MANAVIATTLEVSESLNAHYLLEDAE